MSSRPAASIAQHLTEKGRKLREELTMAQLRRIDRLLQLAPGLDELQAATAVLHLLDRFWTDVADRGAADANGYN